MLPEGILMNSWHYKILYIFCVPICNIFCKCIFFLESAVKYLCVWVTFYAPLWAVERIYNDKFLVLKTKIWKYQQKTRNIYIFVGSFVIRPWSCCESVVLLCKTQISKEKKWKLGKKYNLWTICCFIDFHVNYLSIILFFLFCCNCCKGFKYLWSSLYGDNVILVTCWVL